MESGEDFSTLTIKPASGKYSGKFKVVAENDVGKDEAEMEASVVGEWPSQYTCPLKNELLEDLLLKVTLNLEKLPRSHV